MLELVQHLVNGLSLGSIYALIALGYTLVFGILRFINFAHGDVYMLGAFTGLYWARYFRLAEHPSLWALVQTLLAAMLGSAILGLLIERLAYRPLRKQPRINVLITAIGVSLLLEYSAQLGFGASPQVFPDIFKPNFNLSIGALSIDSLQVFVFLFAVVLMAILHAIVFHTRLGRALRAVSFDPDTASLLGIPTDRIISATFAIGSSLAGAAGVLVGLIYPRIDPFMGVMLGLKAFVAAVLGGIGSIAGAVLGSFVLGMSEEFLVGYGAPTFRDALAFGILILILIIKPTGILGTKRSEKV